LLEQPGASALKASKHFSLFSMSLGAVKKKKKKKSYQAEV
jgi:hypothetical protein